MSVATFHALLDTVLQVNFTGPRNEDSLKDRFKTASNDVILRLFHEIVSETTRDALFDKLVGLLQAVDKLVGLLQAVDNKHLDTPNVEGVTLLMDVADFKYLYGFKTLIDAGANPNADAGANPTAYDSTGMSVLHRVVSKDQCHLAKQLYVDEMVSDDDDDDDSKCKEIINSMLKKLQECPRFRINPTVSSYNNGKRTYLNALKEHDALLAEYFPQRVTCDDIDLFIAAANAEPSSTTVAEYMRDARLSLIEICIRTNTYGPDLQAFNINDQLKTSEEGEVRRMTLLHWAAAQPKYIEIMKLLLEHPGIDLNVLDSKNTAALHYAVRSDNLEGLQLLIEAKAKLDLRGGALGHTALHMSIRQKHLGMTKILLDAGANPNVVERGWGKSALFFALDNPQETKKNNIQLIEWLLAYGADLNVINRYGRTPLHIAIKDRSLDIGQLLLDNGADPNTVDTDQKTALHYAIWYKRKRPFIISLLKARADPNVQDSAGRTALHYAVKKGTAYLFEQLLHHGADPRVRDNQGQTILHYAAEDTSLDLVLQMSKLPDVNVQDNNMRTALHLAANSHHVVMVTALLEKGADPNVQDINGNTALHLANMDIIQLLLKVMGIDVNIRNDENMTVLQQCLAKSTFTHLETVKLLLDKGADPDVRTLQNKTLLMTAIAEHNIELVRMLIAKGADPNGRWKDDDDQHTFALMMAVEEYKYAGEETKTVALDILKVLVRMPNIDLNAMGLIFDANGSGKQNIITALHYAVEQNLVEVVGELLAGGADVNAQTKEGETALHVAVDRNNLHIVKTLLSAGALPNVQDEQGDTALHWAVYENHPAIVAQLLTGNNINTSLMNVMDRTPLQVAIWSNYTKCVNILQEHERHEHERHEHDRHEHERLLKKRSPSPEGSGGGESSKPNITDRLLNKRSPSPSPEGSGGGESSKRHKRDNTTQSVIKLPFSKLKL